jgi:hypothetical protein
MATAVVLLAGAGLLGRSLYDLLYTGEFPAYLSGITRGKIVGWGDSPALSLSKGARDPRFRKSRR